MLEGAVLEGAVLEGAVLEGAGSDGDDDVTAAGSLATSNRSRAPQPKGGSDASVPCPVHLPASPSRLSTSRCARLRAPAPAEATCTPAPTSALAPAENSKAPTVSARTTWVALLQFPSSASRVGVSFDW